MFTGLIEAIGVVRRAAPAGKQMTLHVDLGSTVGHDAQLGDSIAVNGVCLTVRRLQGSCAEFDVSGESLARTTLKSLKPGSKVNLERAMSAQGRFGGHIVQGHIDGLGTIANIRKDGDFATFRITAASELLAQMVVKGSVAVDGISLTVAALDEKGFEAALIPTTLQETTWQMSRVGDVVNIEIDILVKVIRRQVEQLLPDGDTLTVEKLKALGF